MAAYSVTTAGAALEIDTSTFTNPTRPLAIDTNHFFITYAGAANDGYAEVLAVNTSTWAVTTASARLEHDTQNGQHNSTVQVDTNHFVTFFLGGAATTDGFAQAFTVDTSTWAVTTASSKFLFDTDVGHYNAAVMIDANHIINFWSGSGSDGYVQVFTVDTTTWAVTTAAASLEFDISNATYNSAQKIDDNHFINFWAGSGNDAFTQVFTVNTSTWAVTTAAATLEYDTQQGIWNSSYKVDTNHFINFWSDVDGDGKCQVFTVDTTTWAVTTASAVFEFDPQDMLTNSPSAVSQIDDNHFLYLWPGTDTAGGSAQDGFAQVFEINTTTWAVTTRAAVFEYETDEGEYNAVSLPIAGTNNSKFLVVYSGSGDDGFAQVFNVQLSPSVVLNSPADASSDSDTTPTFDFTGTDPNGEDVRYRVLIDTVNTFDSQAASTPSHVQGVNGSSPSSTSIALPAFSSNVTAGNLIVVSIGYGGLSSITGVTDDMGNTYREAATAANGVGLKSSIYYAYNISGGAKPTITVSFSIATASAAIAQEFSDIEKNYDPFDKSAINSGTGGTVTSGNTPTTSYANELIVGSLCDFADNPSVGAGYSNYVEKIDGGSTNYAAIESKTVTSTGAYAATFSGPTSTWAAAVATFKAADGYPLIDKISGTDAGFVNPDVGGDTDPFNSGENIQFTVQAGDALSAGTYYWKVRGIDPSGSNEFGNWSSIRSFTITGGGGSTFTYIPQRMRRGMGI